MANAYDKIDPQLRMAGRIANLIIRPSKLGFKLLHRALSASIGKDIEGVESRTEWVQRLKDEGKIRVRVFRPKTITTPLPIVIYYNGGGYVTGIPEQSLDALKDLMAVRDCIIVAPDYRIALDAPYPAGLNDGYDTLLWAKAQADELGGRSDQIFVMGESAGGGLAVATCLLARDRGEVNIAFQLPLYPMIDDRQTNASAVGNSMPIWNSKHNKLAWAMYLQGLRDQGLDIPAYAAPARAESFANLPPAATFIGELDPFFDEVVQYVEALKQAGIPVQFKQFAGCYHGFERMVASADVSKAATQFMHDAFAHAVDTYFAPQPPLR